MTAITLNQALEKSSSDAWTSIFIFAGVAGVTSAITIPSLNVPKQLLITTTDFEMCREVYVSYFKGEGISDNNIQSILTELGLATVVGGALVWTSLKVMQGLIDEAIQFAPGIGQLGSAGISALATVALGYTFKAYCEKRLTIKWRNLNLPD